MDTLFRMKIKPHTCFVVLEDKHNKKMKIMKNRILVLASILTVVGGTMFAQPQMNKAQKPAGDCPVVRAEQRKGAPMFTEEQKAEMKKIHFETAKKEKPLKDQLRELEAHQQTLVTADAPDTKAINKNIEEIGKLKTDLAKIQVEGRLKARALMTDEQKLMMDSKKDFMHQGPREARRGPAKEGQQFDKRGKMQPRGSQGPQGEPQDAPDDNDMDA